MDFWGAVVPGWLSGIGTVATAGLTVFLLWREQSDRRRQRERDVLVADTERRRQASLVSLSPPNHAMGLEDIYGNVEVSTCAEIVNGSDQPINDVTIWIVVESGTIVSEDAGTYNSTTWGRILPRTHEQFPLTFFVRPDRELSTYSELAFTDAAGTHWLRDRNHNLTEVTAGQTHHGQLIGPR